MSNRPPTIFRYPLSEKFVWREWTVPLALAVAVAALVVARAALAPAPTRLEVPAPAVVEQPVRQLAALAETPPSTGPPLPETVETPGVSVLLRCEGTTWVEATADGEQPRRYELGPGQSLAITAHQKLSLSLGDAGVLRLRVNERELGFIGDRGETKIGLSFTAAKTAPAAALPAAAGD